MDRRIEVIVADITTLKLDAIVNAANSALLGGGGVDGAIHRKAGPRLLAHCLTLGGCSAGEAKISPGFDLPAKFVIHTVGPVWSGGNNHEDKVLAACYRRSLEVALDNGVRTIAFPAISTGAYRFPAGQAAKIAVRTVSRVIAGDDRIDRVQFCCFSTAAADMVSARLSALEPTP
jgi:O-acetyl-ADP-ribose deacetylase (regulator of RNase III)